jgi:hypothetical protein
MKMQASRGPPARGSGSRQRRSSRRSSSSTNRTVAILLPLMQRPVATQQMVVTSVEARGGVRLAGWTHLATWLSCPRCR